MVKGRAKLIFVMDRKKEKTHFLGVCPLQCVKPEWCSHYYSWAGRWMLQTCLILIKYNAEIKRKEMKTYLTEQIKGEINQIHSIIFHRFRADGTCDLVFMWSEQFEKYLNICMASPCSHWSFLTLLQKEINMKYESFQYCLGLQNKSISHGRQQSNGDSAWWS